MKKFCWYLLLFFGCFLVFFVAAIIKPIWCDEIWVYGFSHNIAKGMVIYRDFNVLQMPLYFFISSFFLRIFGDYIISIHIFDCLLISFLFLMMYRKLKWKTVLVLSILFIGYSGYNLLSLFLFMCILFCIDRKIDDDFLIGIVIGLIFITKQNLGIVLFFPYFYYSKKKLRSIFFFLLPFLIVGFYFFVTSSFGSFLDYVFGSILDFDQHNKKILLFFGLIEVLVICHLIYLILKDHFRDKRLLYVLAFQVLAYPICDDGHLFLALYPYFYLLFDYDFSMKKYYGLFFLGFYSLFSLTFSSIDISFRDDLFYLRNSISIDYAFLNDFSELSSEYDNYFIADWYAYVYKLYYQIPIGKYDFVLSGNAGYLGVSKKIKEIDNLCKEESCLFAISQNDFDSSFSQWKEFIDDIKNNYHYMGKKNAFYFFSN